MRISRVLCGFEVRAALSVPLVALVVFLRPSPLAAKSSLGVVYLVEANVSELLERPSTTPGDCLFKQPICLSASNTKKSISVRDDSSSAVDETGNRFNCKNAYWYDLSCRGQASQDRAPAAVSAPLLLIDVSQSMRHYDPPRNGDCARAKLLRALRTSGSNARAFGHAEALQAEIPYKTLSDAALAATVCQTLGDNATTRVLDQAHALKGASNARIVMITDASEQTPRLSAYLRARGGLEIFASSRDLEPKTLGLIRP